MGGMAKATFTVEVEYDPEVADVEALTAALNVLMENALAPGILDDLGNPMVGDFEPLDVPQDFSDPDKLKVECIDCKEAYTVSYREGQMWPPEACGKCGSVRIVVAH